MVLECAEDKVDEGQHHAVKPGSKRGSKRTAAEVMDIPAASPTNALASLAAAPALDAAAGTAATRPISHQKKKWSGYTNVERVDGAVIATALAASPAFRTAPSLCWAVAFDSQKCDRNSMKTSYAG